MKKSEAFQSAVPVNLFFQVHHERGHFHVRDKQNYPDQKKNGSYQV